MRDDSRISKQSFLAYSLSIGCILFSFYLFISNDIIFRLKLPITHFHLTYFLFGSLCYLEIYAYKGL